MCHVLKNLWQDIHTVLDKIISQWKDIFPTFLVSGGGWGKVVDISDDQSVCGKYVIYVV